MVLAESATNTISQENASTTTVRMAVAMSESVFLIPHLARMAVNPAKTDDKIAAANHIPVSSNDTMRLKWAVAEVKGLDYRRLECVCIGEHGDAQVRLLDQMTYDGQPLTLTAEETETVICLTKERFKEFSGLGIKRSTGWTSGVNLAEMIEAIMTDSKKLLPCSAVFGGEFGYNDVACGALCRLGKNGVEEITLPLNNGQKAEMDAAVAKIKEQISWTNLLTVHRMKL